MTLSLNNWPHSPTYQNLACKQALQNGKLARRLIKTLKHLQPLFQPQVKRKKVCLFIFTVSLTEYAPIAVSFLALERFVTAKKFKSPLYRDSRALTDPALQCLCSFSRSTTLRRSIFHQNQSHE